MAVTSIAAQYNNPDLAYRQKLQEGELQRRQSDADTRNKQLQIEQDEHNRNALTAENYALTQSHGMQSTDAPRTVTDTSMTIGTGGGSASRAASGSGSRLATGGFGSANPQIDGRYMSLVQFQQPNLATAPQQPRETLGSGGYGPQDAKAYQDAQFARLKDKSGSLGQGALQSLASTLAGRGISGQSGTFGRGLSDIITRSVQPLADLNVEHLGQEYAAAGHERDLSEQRASTAFNGGIQQRGQDMSSQQAMNNLLTQIAQIKYQGEIGQRDSQADRDLQLQKLYGML
jgi:hypothetical protein